MPVELPTPITAYIAGSNAHDAVACAACFTDDAIVRDEGREREGVAEIREWMEEVSRKYRPTVDVVDVAATGDRTIITGRVAGDFPGSPVELRYAFTLAGAKIARLEIR
jgi:uncharacterized protein (TIGR02246 family)